MNSHHILYGIFFLFAWAGAQQDSLVVRDTGKPNVALASFNDKTGEAASFVSLIREVMTDYLIQTRRFSLVSRDKLEEVLKEKSLRLSGITTAKEVEAISKILHVDFFVTGDIVDLQYQRRIIQSPVEEERVRVPKKKDARGNVIEWEYKTKRTGGQIIVAYVAKARISGKLISASTSRISEAKIGESTLSMQASQELRNLVLRDIRHSSSSVKTKSLAEILAKLVTQELQKALRQEEKRRLRELEKKAYAEIKRQALVAATQNLVTEIVKEIKIVGTVIRAEEKRILISLGKNHGLFARCNLRVYVIEEEKHPVTGETFPYKREVATLLVTKIDDDYCYAKIFSGKIKSLRPGMKVEVVRPRFKFTAMLPSMILPGLSQILYRKYGKGIAYMVVVPALIGTGAAALVGGFDTVFGDEDDPRQTAQLFGWTMIGLGIIGYIANLIDAGFPARKNPVFKDRPVGIFFNAPLYPEGWKAYSENSPWGVGLRIQF